MSDWLPEVKGTPKKRPKRRWWAVAARPIPSGQALPMPLDLVPGATAAYSYRKLTSAYAGAAVNVRRASDNATQDVGFTGQDFSAATFQNFIAATTGWAGTWYDQSGNADNAVQATAANQPQIVTPGAPVAVYGGQSTGGSGQRLVPADSAGWQNIWAAGGFVAIAFLAPLGTGTAVFVSKGSASGGWLIYTHQSTDHQVVFYVKAATTDAIYWTNQTISTSQPHVVTVAWNSSTPATPGALTIDGVACTLFTNQTPVGAIGSDVGSPPIIGNDFVLNSGNVAPQGNLYEVLVYNTIPSPANQTALINNMRAYFGTP